MVLLARRINHDIIKISYHEYVKLLRKSSVYKVLERYGCVRKPKGYYYILEKAILYLERGLLFFSANNPNLVVGIADV